MADRPEILQLARYQHEIQAALDERFVTHKGYEAVDRVAFAARLGDRVRGVASGGEVPMGREIVEALPKLEIVSVFGVGYDGVDREALREKGVRLTNTPDVLSEEVADFAIAMALAQIRRIVKGDAHVRSGAWANGPAPLTGRFHGSRVGVLGMGRIGKEIARRCEAFSCDIAYCARSEKPELSWRFFADPAALAEWADVLFVITPGGAGTEGLVSRQVLEALGPEGLLVNVSRGSVVDEAALIDLLASGGLGGAALDVFLNEPHPDRRLLEFDNVLLQPHHASGTVATRRDMGMLMVDNLAAHFEGRPLITPVPL